VRLQGKVAIVTGAGRGIGRSIALRLAQEGADVLVSDVDGATAENTAREVAALGGRSVGMRTDVTRPADTKEMAARALAELGGIDILVNNAGIVQVKPWLELAGEDLDRMFGVNVKGTLFASQAVAPTLVQQRSGRIINIASVAAKLSRPYFLHYAASKAAVVSMTRGMALYFAPYNVTCNSVCPGTVDTKMWEYLDEALGALESRPKGEALKQRIGAIPLGRVEQPEDVAGVVTFLSSEDSGYMTGQSLLVDGGLFME
jgi:acetoin reductase-like protein